MYDAIALGYRVVGQFKTGLDNPNGRLTEDQVGYIKFLATFGQLAIGQGARDGFISLPWLAKELGVSRGAISHIVRGVRHAR